MKCQILFFRKKKKKEKNINSLLSAEFAHSMVRRLYIHEPCQAKKCLRTCTKHADSDHSAHGQSSSEELSNFITFPRTSKWSKSTCPTKIYLPKNCQFFLFLKALLMSAHNVCFLRKLMRKIYIIILILYLARAMNYLSQDKKIEISYLLSWTSRAWYFHSSGQSIIRAFALHSYIL